jgi:hypothetical protein
MIKAIAHGANGRKILVLGLSFGDLREAPGDTFIRVVDGKEMGLDMDVMIISGETEAHMAETLAGIGPDTKVHVSPRSRS